MKGNTMPTIKMNGQDVKCIIDFVNLLYDPKKNYKSLQIKGLQ